MRFMLAPSNHTAPRWLGGLCALTLVLAACQDETGESATRDVGADILTSAERGNLDTPEGNISRPAGPPTGLTRPENLVPIAQLGHTMGDTAAPIRIVEFSDFGCGYCRTFHMDIFPTLEEEYIETGKVQWKYVPMILGIFGPNAEHAARAAECALEQDRFPAMRDRLFEAQGEWKGARDVRAIFEEYAGDMGLDVEEWGQCYDENRPADRIASGTIAAQRAGLRGTPTFYIIDYTSIPGSLPLEMFQMVLDTVYADATSR